MFIISIPRLTVGKLKISDETADKIARLVIMIETGKRLYIDDQKVKDPEPFTIKDMGYCKVAMYCTEGRMIILCPYDVDSNRAISVFVQTITDSIRKYEYETPGLVLDSDIFERATMSYDTQPANMRGVQGGLFKRLFKLDDTHIDDSAFEWIIRDTIPSFYEDPKTTFEWTTMRNAIVIDLTGHLQQQHNMLIEYPRVTSQIDILTQCGIIPKNTVVHRWYLPPPGGESDECFGIQPLFRNTIVCPPITVVAEINRSCAVLHTLDSKSIILARKSTDVPRICEKEVCQICAEMLHDTFYIVFHSKNIAYGFCKFCVRTKKFHNRARDMLVYRTTHARTIEHVCQDIYGMSYNTLLTCNELLTEYKNDSAEKVLYNNNVMLLFSSHMYGQDMTTIDMFLTSVEPINRRIVVLN